MVDISNLAACVEDVCCNEGLGWDPHPANITQLLVSTKVATLEQHALHEIQDWRDEDEQRDVSAGHRGALVSDFQ